MAGQLMLGGLGGIVLAPDVLEEQRGAWCSPLDWTARATQRGPFDVDPFTNPRSSKRPMIIRLGMMKSNNAEGVLLIDARMPEARELAVGEPLARNRPSEIYLSVEVMLPTDAPCEATDRWVRAHVRWLLLHELDEFIVINGVRQFDPHRDGRTPTPENT